MTQQNILIVEDNDSLREVLVTVLEREHYAVYSAPTVAHALEQFKVRPYDCILSDYKLPGESGLDLLAKIRAVDKNVPFVIMTAYGSVDIAIEAMKGGATDFLSKPFEPDHLCKVLGEVIKYRRIVERDTGTWNRRSRKFLSTARAVEPLLEQVRKVARVDSSVLILGESGTGKELLARHIHEQSPRSAQPFVAVNCAALPKELLESEFFGHEMGSFTGATQTRTGVFEIASEGTIFLDEVGDMPAVLQVKLLRALQEREIKRVGGSRMIKVNPRIIAATNRNVVNHLASGTLREDFYYRIAVVTLEIPPLRERREDILPLAEYFAASFAESSGTEPKKISTEARKMLEEYPWPGNARELENVIERAVVLAPGEITAAHLGLSIIPSLLALQETARTLPEIAARAAQQVESELILQTLERTGGNKLKASEILGVSYKTLLNKIKEYQLEYVQQ